MTSRERVLLALSHRKPDRVPIHDEPWETTIERWKREGMPPEADPKEYFGYEFRLFGFDGSLQLPGEIVEETDEYVIVRNADGATRKDWKHQTSTPGYHDFLVTDRTRWEEFRSRLTWNDTRVDWEKELTRFKREKEAGRFCVFAAVTGYDRLQGLVGSERLLIALLEDPDWVRDMFETVGELTLHAAEEMLSRGFDFDGVWLFNDMGYRNATLFAPRLYQELIKPVDQKLVDFFHGRGLKVILHSCGCVKELIPDLIEVGFDCLQPLETKAGMDLIELKRQYGEALAFMGGIDVRKMAHPDPRVIEEEIRTKLAAGMSDGAYIYHSDHSVPDNVSLERYRYVLKLVREIGTYGRPA